MQNILPPIIDESTQVLILGSMPSQLSLEKQQYYGNPRNHFWSIIGTILQVEVPEDYSKRVELLKVHHIGLWDTIQSCERQGSLDANIRNIVPNDFRQLFIKYPTIRLLLFNGGKAYSVFKKYMGLQLLQKIEYAKMPSSSPIPGKNIKSFEEKVEEWRIMEKYL
ncbi:DNA-deoxyinosine glycosylase [Rummeliibacillus pycnus]|uniref:DNA-deoxyinosine glycosylase n=1 Tax=Rummeliibacillus pycnus TaxID=101070 RepID=UPI000C9BF1E0|nr:DNA-deoxyinosine glycosylase [Rummeliibacillus pycnus]